MTKIFPNWFGKGCDYFNGIWEETEYTGGPDFKEYEPVLSYCNHKENHSDTEGNCQKYRCPIDYEI